MKINPKLKTRFSVVLGMLLVAQCCCCIVPLRLRVDLESPNLTLTGSKELLSYEREPAFTRTQTAGIDSTTTLGSLGLDSPFDH